MNQSRIKYTARFLVFLFLFFVLHCRNKDHRWLTALPSMKILTVSLFTNGGDKSFKTLLPSIKQGLLYKEMICPKKEQSK